MRGAAGRATPADIRLGAGIEHRERVAIRQRDGRRRTTTRDVQEVAPGRSRSLAWLLAGSTTLGLGGVASAAELHVEGPVRCVDRAELSFRVEHTLGRPLEEAVPLQVAVRVQRDAARCSARVDVSAADGPPLQRVVTASSCEELTDSLTVVIALALASDSAQTEASDPVGEAAPMGKGSGAATATHDDGGVASSAREALPEPSAVVPGASLWVVGDAGSLPESTLGVALGVEVGTRRWQLRAVGTLLLDQEHQLGSTEASGPGAELGLATGALLACALSVGSLPPLQLRACAGWELGQLSGVGTGVPSPRQGSAFWSAPVIDVGALWNVPGTAFLLGALVDVAAPLGRDQFVLGELGRVHRPASVVGRVALGAGLMLD